MSADASSGWTPSPVVRHAGHVIIPRHYTREQKAAFLNKVMDMLAMLAAEVEKGEPHEGTVLLNVSLEGRDG